MNQKILKIYFNKLDEHSKFKPDSVLNEEQQEIEKFETFFKKANLFKKSEYKQKPKYYLQGKTKKKSSGIQHSIKKEVDKLNKIYEDKIYFISVNKKVLEKNENIHVYNVFNTTIIEYVKVNIFNDIILGNNSVLYNKKNINPLSLINLTNTQKIELYNILENFLNTCNIHVEYDKEHEFYYYNKFIDMLNNVIQEYVLNKFSNKNETIQKIITIIDKYDKTIKISNSFSLFDILEQSYNKFDENDINKIIDLIILNEYDYNLKIVNSNVFKIK